MRQVLLVETSFQIGAGIHTWRTVRLKKHQVPAMVLIAGMKEMVKTHLK